MNITLQDLGLAYRKAKVDLYYSSNASLLAILNYEKNLTKNLQLLHKKLNQKNQDWIKTVEFLGGWSLLPKSIKRNVVGDEKKTDGSPSNGLIFSSPKDEWSHSCKQLANSGKAKKPEAEFRIMAQASLDFHVVSALWMLKVGHLYDAKLNRCAYGNRLRRKKNLKINPLSLGSFLPYLRPFRNWRDNGIDAMRKALADGKKIVALTADVSSFYHKLNPDFMLDPEFNKIVGLELSKGEASLHKLFINALKEWGKNTPLGSGLPVGLPASAVVANLALIELDRMIEQQVIPLYYGRYVDDILLVMENGANFQSTSELWQWLFDRSGGKLNWVEGKEHEQIQFQPEYLKKQKKQSEIRFANSKNKVFMLVGETGKTLVDSIARQIQERASEWRCMPKLPRDASRVGTDLVAATQSDGEAVDNLRKTDALTMRRASFAIKLRDLEAYERDLNPDAWQVHRHAFFRAFLRHVLVLPQFFELAIYLPRILRLATSCQDFDHLRKMLDGLERLYQTILSDCKVSIKSCSANKNPDSSEIIERWKNQVFESAAESIVAAFPFQLSKTGKKLWKIHMQDYLPNLGNSSKLKWPNSIADFESTHLELFVRDLAHLPFRFAGIPREMTAGKAIPEVMAPTSIKNKKNILKDEVVEGVSCLVNLLGFKDDMPCGFVWPTRPFNLAELHIIAKSPFEKENRSSLRSIVLALRGFALTSKTPFFDDEGVLQIPDGKSREKHTIAVSSWKTHQHSWVASVTRSLDPDHDRYARMNRLIDGVISQGKGVNYFILPELAMPARWFMRAALKLQARGISIITGVEYFHSGKSSVHNQVWASLSHDGLGFPSLMVYRQDKQRPALHEEQELRRLGNVEMIPSIKWETPPLIQHGDFRFALLICSELTNIAYRAALRGKVDALFVPEWNQDTETYNALVESAALDIHAYIIQCNDRQYGDSRIRAPSKESWQRDILRVKGGIDDYCVSGVIDVHALRKFQSSHRSPTNPFKPTPDGFQLSESRRTLPTGG